MIKKRTVSKKTTASKKKTGTAKSRIKVASRSKPVRRSKSTAAARKKTISAVKKRSTAAAKKKSTATVKKRSTAAAKKRSRPRQPKSIKAKPKKRQPVRKKTTRTRPASKTTAVKKTKAVKKITRAKTVITRKSSEDQTKALKELAAKRKQQTPAIFKLPSKRRPTPAIFSLDDVREVIKVRKAEPKPAKKKVVKPAVAKTGKPTQAVADVKPEIIEPRVLEAASLSDVLGFNPAGKPKKQVEERKVPLRRLKHYRRLVKLRKQMEDILNLHTKDTLKRSIKEDSGDLSGYSQHMADAGTDNFDRDFALSMVSNEQEVLKEIDEAIKRIFAGTYGICEVTGKPIGRARLAAVPFTRFSVEGQTEYEKTHRKSSQRMGLFIDSGVGDTVKFTDEDSEE